MKGLFSRRSQKRRADPQELLQTIFAFIQARTWDESRRVVETHPELLTGEADDLMEQLAEAQEDSTARRVVEEHRILLRRCREVGLDAAFAAKTGAAGGIPIPPEFQANLRQAQEALQRYLHTGDRAALNGAATAWGHILNHAAFTIAPERFQLAVLNDAGRAFLRRYWSGGRLEDLNQALTCWQQAVERTPPDSPDLPAILSNLGSGLCNRYARTGWLENLEEAIRVYQQAVQRTPPDSSALPMYLNNLGSALCDRYARTGRLGDLQEAIRVCKQAVNGTPIDSPNLASRLNTLAIGLRDRYARTGRLEDLEEAIRACKQAVQYISPDSPDLPFYLDSVGTSLSYRHAHTGRLEDLEEAVRVYQQAVDCTPTDSPHLPSRLNNLSNSLRSCYARTRRTEDLEGAIRVSQQAVDRTPPDSPELPCHLNNLGIGLYGRYTCTGRLEDLEEAISVLQEAVQCTPSDSPDFSPHLNNLGNSLRDRYSHTGRLEDLEEAIRVCKQVVNCTPTNFPDFSRHLNNLGSALHSRYIRSGRLEDLEEMVRVCQQAVDHTPTDSPELLHHLNKLGTGLYKRYARMGILEDLREAISVYQKGLAAADRAFLLSPIAYQLGQQTNWADFNARAVDVHLQAGKTAQALAIAEGSKSRLLTTLLGWGQLPTPPTVPPGLAQREQGMAARLAALDTADLARHGRTTPSDEGADRVAHLRQRQALLEALNALWEQMIHDSGDDPEVTDYVELRRGDRPDWEDLAHLAADLGGDTALLSLFTTGEQTLLFVLRAGMDAPEVVEAPLDGTAWTGMLRRFLREVHSYDGSGRRGETWLRPLLPLLEAAVPHLPGARRAVFAPEGRGHLLPWELLAWRAGWEAPVVTVPALGLLERVLRRPARDGTGALVVGNPTGELRYAQEEARRVAGVLGTRPLVGRKATRQAVLSRLGEVGLAHFATHAYFAPGSPLDSGIVLADGVLTAREILERRLRVPEFLALSACQTGMAGSLGGDEMAGLSQALLYAGARSLLVSLWAVNDPATAHLMTGFYRRWRKEGQDKATALRDAMDATRRARPAWAHTYYWGAFTLVGDWR